MNNWFKKNKLVFLALVLIFLIAAFSSPSVNYLKDRKCKPGDSNIVSWVKNILGKPVNAQACSWTASPVCTNVPPVKARTTFSWPSYPPGTGCPSSSYTLTVTGAGGGTFSGLTGTSKVVDLNLATPYTWTVGAVVYDNIFGVCTARTVTPAAPAPAPFTTPSCPVPEASIFANNLPGPITVAPGENFTVTWCGVSPAHPCANATSCTVTFSDAGGSWVGTSGTQTYSIVTSRTHNLTCSNAYSSASASVTVNVVVPPPSPAPTLSLGAVACNSVGLSWTASTGATGYRIFRNAVNIATTAALTYTDGTVTQNTAYSYYVQAYNGSGSVNSNTVSPTTPYCPPTVTLNCNGSHGPLTVPAGSTCSLTWTSTNATSCTASGGVAGWPGAKATSGSQVSGPINSSTTFTLNCTGPGGSTAPLDSVIVNTTGFAPPSWIEIHP